MSDRSEEWAWKVLTGVAAAGAGIAARKVINVLWKSATGKEPPANPESPDVSLGEAVGWAVFSGAVMGVARMAATRQAAHQWRRTTGELPLALREKLDGEALE